MTEWGDDSLNDDGEDILELTDIATAGLDTGEDQDFIELTDIVENAGKDEDGLAKIPVLTSEQVEAALERVIEKQFADKIQTILFQVVEKVIEREIIGIKESLQKDLDQIGTV